MVACSSVSALPLRKCVLCNTHRDHLASGHAFSPLSPHAPLQNKYKTSVKKKAERQILAVKPSATEEELSAVFEQEVRLVWFASIRVGLVGLSKFGSLRCA